MSAPLILLENRLPPKQLPDKNITSGFLDSNLHPEQVLLNVENLSKNDAYMLQQYILWVKFQPGCFLYPNLAAFRDYLLSKELNTHTVGHYLSFLRKRYEALARDRDLLFSFVTAPMDWGLKKLVVDEIVARIQNALHPDLFRLRHHTTQDELDKHQRRLTREQSDLMLHMPGIDTLLGLRNTAIIALMLCTGIREAEVVDLNISDLRQVYDGQLALLVRRGKGNKKRLIPYGELNWCLSFVDTWLQQAEIQSDAVFRRLYWCSSKKQHKILSHENHLHPCTVNEVLSRYPIQIDGEMVTVRPHDLRRTYARRCFEAGMRLESIQRNLGHVDYKTTMLYIGALDGTTRRPPAAYNEPLDLLQQLSSTGERVR
jgi:site-specific recombinase XerD